MKVEKDKKDLVLKFIQSADELTKHFGCEGDFFLKPLTNLEWAIRDEEDFHFLSYWGEDGKKIEAVVVRKNGEPLIFREKSYTMVVAIDCVKIGFIFKSDKEMGM